MLDSENRVSDIPGSKPQPAVAMHAAPQNSTLPTDIKYSNRNRGTLYTEIVSLESQRDRLWSDIIHDRHSSDARILRLIATLAKREWLQHQNQYAHQDSLATIQDLFTRPSAETILLWARSPRRYSGSEPQTLVGAGLILSDPEQFPDFDEIPWQFLRDTVLPAAAAPNPGIYRGIRAFVSRTAYSIAPTERPLDLITANSNEVTRGGIILTKINKDNKTARNAFTSLGYEPTGQLTPDGSYEWLVFPPYSSRALQEYTLSQNRLITLSLEEKRGITHAATHFDPLGNDLAILGNSKFALRDTDSLARVFSYSTVYAFSEKAHTAGRRERTNLLFLPESENSTLFPDKLLGGTLISYAPEYDSKPLAAYLQQASNSTISGGKVIIKTTASSEDHIEAALNTHQLRLLSIASLPTENPTRVIISEKVSSDQTLAIRIKDAPVSVPDQSTSFVDFSYMRHKETGRQWELGTFANDIALDALPVFEHGGQLYAGIVSRPRPIPHLVSTTLDGSTTGAFMTEQVASYFLHTSPENAQTEIKEFLLSARQSPQESMSNHLHKLLESRAGIHTSAIDDQSISIQHYYSSPGTVGEAVLACTVDVKPFRTMYRDPHVTGFADAGTFQPVLAQRALAAAHIGALSDGRVERMVYKALIERQKDPGQWLGTPIDFYRKGSRPPIRPVEALLQVPERAAFERLNTRAERRYLDHKKITVAEYSAHNRQLSEVTLEYIEPHHSTGISNNTISIVPLIKTETEILVGLEIRDLPAPQLHGFSSAFYAIPAYRLPRKISDMQGAAQFVTSQLANDFGLLVDTPKRLGAHYYPTAGLTPETVYPQFAEVADHTPKNDDLHWFNLKDVIKNLHGIRGGHTLTGLYRVGHALGMFNPEKG